MSIWQVIVLLIWTVVGAYRYIEWRDENDRGVDPDLDGVHWYTILVHGPFWWLIKSLVLIGRLLRILKVAERFNRIFVIRRKDE